MVGMSRLQPSLVIAGAPRCGTTSLFRWLADHPQIGSSSVKETFFLMDDGVTVKNRGRYLQQGLDGYAAFFQHLDPLPAQLMEATPGYLYQQTALRVFAEELTETKLLFVLRRPADRLLSTYRYFATNWAELDRDEVDFFRYVEWTKRGDDRLKHSSFLQHGFDHGFYAKWLQPWFDRCGAERIRVLVFESWRQDRVQGMRELADWLKVDANFYDDYGYPKENEAYAVRRAGLQKINRHVREWIPEGGLRRLLKRLYRKTNTRAGRESTSDRDLETLRQLDADYAADAGRLRDQFGLDVAPWEQPR